MSMSARRSPEVERLAGALVRDGVPVSTWEEAGVEYVLATPPPRGRVWAIRVYFRDEGLPHGLFADLSNRELWRIVLVAAKVLWTHRLDGLRARRVEWLGRRCGG